MPEVVLQWKMQCRNTAPPLGSHQIEIPSPRHLELLADRQRLETGDLETIFACPHCGHVYSYKESDALCWQTIQQEGQSKPQDVYPLCVKLPCVVEGCVPHTEVRTTRYASETPDLSLIHISQLICKMDLKTNSQMHVHGADGLHVGVDTEAKRLVLYWGESKIYANATDAIRKCLSSLAPMLRTDENGSGPADRDLQLLRRYADLDDADLEEAFRHFLDPQ